MAKVRDIAISAEGRAFDYPGGQMIHIVDNGSLPQRFVFSEICCTDAKPRRWTLPLVIYFDVIRQVQPNEDWIFAFMLVNRLKKAKIKSSLYSP